MVRREGVGFWILCLAPGLGLWDLRLPGGAESRS